VFWSIQAEFALNMARTNLVLLPYVSCFDTIAEFEITGKTALMPNILLEKALPRENLMVPNIRMLFRADVIIEWQ
jgi:hypothetical protein